MLIRHIRYLLAVVEHRNFTRAAEALYVSQPTLSQQIRQLEDELGVQLLDRSGRTVRATDAGEAYIAYARRALREFEAGERAVHDVRDLTRGTLRLATTPTFTSYLVGPLIARFNASYPGISLLIKEMPLDTIESALAADEVDLGIAFSKVRSAEIDCHPLFVEKLSVVVGVDHPFAQRAAAIAPKDLEQEPLALLTADFATRSYVDAYLQKQGIAPKIVIEANTINAIVEIVRRGSMATILPDAITRENAALRNIALKPALPHRTVALLRRKGSYQSAAALAFAELVESMMTDGTLT
ncbi:transcriptional regulator CynR [Paraherbaspirillum soli]|uniref:Transcriptional regulator CynR n=1 Tax=Paraherbaspirillum soli TaxID=631222 RepID=A0ABW0M403_9BURK